LTTSDSALSQKVRLCSDTDAVIHKFTSAITAACEATFQVLKPGKCASKKRSVPWWTSDLTLLRKKALALRRRYQRTKTDANLRHERRLLYLECNRLYQAKLREQKLKSWKDFCTSIESSNPWNAVYRYAAGKLRSKPTLSTLKISNNTYTTDIQSTVNQLMDNFIPEDSEYNDRVHHKRARQQVTEPMHTPDDDTFTKQEIQAVLEKFDPRKATGEDALNSEILLRTFRSFPTFFTEIYNECLRRGIFPKQWKRSIILPIVKPGKEGINEVSKYRPISLLNIGGKVLEKLLIDRINHHLHSNSLLNKNQYGFLPQKSTVDAALAAKEFAQAHLQQKNLVIMTSLDVKGAFDAAWWPSILCNLRDLRCPRNLYNLTRSYFSDRVAIFHANTYSVERKVSMGCPQGSCCGPGFWNVLYNALLNLEFSSHTKIIAFADDLAILTHGKTLTEAEVYANSDLAKIENWARENKMQFNESKSKAMLITRKRSRNDINIYLNNRKLEQVTEMKYLGIYFDSRLTFHKHIEHIAQKSRTLIYMLSRTAKLHWGLGHKSLKTVYEGALVPLMTYGAPVWEEAVTKQRSLRMMQSAQRLINIKISKAYRTTSYEASCVMAGVPPIGIVITGKVQLYKRKHCLESSEHACDMPLPVNKWPHPARRVTIMETSEQTTYPIEIYTDGSKDEGKVGAGVVIYSNKQLVTQCKYKLQSCCSNNQAEQIAILKALEQLPELDNPTDRTVAIFTDSKVTMDSLKNHSMHSFLIEEIRNKVRHLSILNWTIHFGWVKAHIGIEGNEAADKLAKEAAQDENDQNIVYSRIPATTVATEINKQGIIKWQRQWNSTEKGALCRSFFPVVERRLQMKLLITPEFTALITGHVKTKAHLHRFKLADDHTCPCNEGVQTPEHIIHDC
jgi:ribonuclease HI